LAGFVSVERLSLGPWQSFERTIQRLLLHLGFVDVDLVGQVGDAGADVVGELRGVVWAAQAKFRSNGTLVGTDPIDEVTVAVDRYGARVAVVATNTGFTSTAVASARRRSADLGIPFYLWDGDWLLERYQRLAAFPTLRDELRPYQSAALDAIEEAILQGTRAGLLLMATGLGKTRVAASVIERWLSDHPNDECLILVPSLSLVPQFEASLWPYLSKQITTHVMTGSEKPAYEGGVTIATEQSMLKHVLGSSSRYGLVIVDEAHHAPADAFRSLLHELDPTFLLGLTATPWRGDDQSLEEIFGKPTFAMSIVEGMQMGYLARVDYRMLLDDIDWDWVHARLDGAVTVRDLNRHLFVPERDEAVVAKIHQHITALAHPRCIVFCRSVRHAEKIARLLKADGLAVSAVHSAIDKKDTTRILHAFRSGALSTLIAVDMLNEGIDVPDVNLIVFLRVTHSRRIFIQQLGRGLRIAEGKQSVLVLDFVSDIRRIGAAVELNREARELADPSRPTLQYPTGQIVHFENDKALSFFAEYLKDVAELDSEDDSATLKFPAPL
jgi:superfamily II DNA or RNA helicase